MKKVHKECIDCGARIGVDIYHGVGQCADCFHREMFGDDLAELLPCSIITQPKESV